MRKIVISMAAAGVAAAAAIVPLASANASTTTKLTTISAEHADTTSVSGTATESGPGGPIWASDHLQEAITVTSAGVAGHYNVVIRFGGSTFAGFADPRMTSEGSSNPGGPLFSQGRITGSITYDDIASSTGPDAANVPASQAPNTSLGQVLNELFQGNNQPATSTHYSITYTPGINAVDPTGNSTDSWTAGTPYTQSG